MKRIQSIIKHRISHFQKELEEAIFTLKAKGPQYFQRVWLASFLMLFVSYKGIYIFLNGKVAQVESEITVAHLTAKYADTYKNAAGQLSLAQKRLPPFKDKDTWLTDTGIASLKAESLVPDSISSPQESESIGLKQEKISIEFQAKFPQLVSWLNRIDHAPRLTHVSSLELSKKGLDENEVHCELVTIVSPGGSL
jgi:type II secretory pathway component PulM